MSQRDTLHGMCQQQPGTHPVRSVHGAAGLRLQAVVPRRAQVRLRVRQHALIAAGQAALAVAAVRKLRSSLVYSLQQALPLSMAFQS